jgi:HSP20 family molecular chaperone IbpA
MRTNLTTFDVLFKDLFNTNTTFDFLSEAKIPHPVDIYETKSGLTIEVACTGLSKDDVNIDIEGDTIRIAYKKQEEDISNRTYQVKGIAKRSFNLAYKISFKYDLSKCTASMSKGLLSIQIPVGSENAYKQIQIAEIG